MIWRPASGIWTTDRIDCSRVIENHARHRSEIIAAPAEDRGAAEHDGGDRRQEIGVPHALRGLAGVAGEQDAAERGQAAGNRENGEHDLLRVDAGEIGRPLAVADAVDRAAEGGAGEQEDRRGADDPPDDQRVGNAVEGGPGGQRPHRRRRGVLGRKSAGVDDHEPLRDGVDRQRHDHRRNAQIGDAVAVDEPDRDAAGDAEGNRERIPGRPPAGGGRRHHAADRDGPRDGEVDLPDQNDDHRPGRDYAEKGSHLQLLQKVFGRQEAARVERAHQEERNDAGERHQDRAIDPPEEPVAEPRLRQPAHRKSSSRFLTRKSRAAPSETAASRTTPWNSGCHSGSRLKTNKRSPMVRNISAPKIAPIALPEPP